MTMNLRRKSLGVALAAALVLGTFCTQATADATPLIRAMDNGQDTPSLAPMLKQVIPAVVNISVKGKKDVRPMLNIPEEFRFMRKILQLYHSVCIVKDIFRIREVVRDIL